MPNVKDGTIAAKKETSLAVADRPTPAAKPSPYKEPPKVTLSANSPKTRAKKPAPAA